MRVFYQIEEWCDVEEGIFYDCESGSDFELSRNIAEDCAADAWMNHDGWESAWPLTFLIYDSPYPEGDGNCKGRVRVDVEQTPRFFATQCYTLL